MVYISGEALRFSPRETCKLYSEVESLRYKVSAADIVFRDPDYFTAGQLHQHYEVWEFIQVDFHEKDEVLRYIKEGFLTFCNLSKVSLKARIMIHLSQLK